MHDLVIGLLRGVVNLLMRVLKLMQIMRHKDKINSLLSVTSRVAVAQTPMEMPAHSPEPTNQFRRIDQPLGLKISVTV